MKKVLIILLLIMSFSAHAKKIPNWYEHKYLEFPDEFFLTFIGSGKDENAAKNNALSEISLFFETKAEVLQNFSESYENQNLLKSRSFSAKKYSEFSSNAEFFGVKYTTPFWDGTEMHILAYIERENAFSACKQKIDLNSRKMEDLLIVAEDINNPFMALEAANEAIPIAEETVPLIHAAQLLKSVGSNYFLETISRIQRVYSSFLRASENRTVALFVVNDKDGIVYNEISKLLGSIECTVSSTDGICKMFVNVEPNREDLPAGIFLHASLNVVLKGGTDEVIFSYTRNFDKKGAKTEQLAYRLMFMEIQSELDSSFLDEFNKQTKLKK